MKEFVSTVLTWLGGFYLAVVLVGLSGCSSSEIEKIDKQERQRIDNYNRQSFENPTSVGVIPGIGEVKCCVVCVKGSSPHYVYFVAGKETITVNEKIHKNEIRTTTFIDGSNYIIGAGTY